MKIISFTTRIDEELKLSLDEIAKNEDRDATRQLIKTGLEVFEKTGESISAESVNLWLESDDDTPFPSIDTFE